MYRMAITVALCLLSFTTAVQADRKNVSGSICRAANQAHAERLVYNLRGVRNRDRNKKARVICPLLRDNFDVNNFDNALLIIDVAARVQDGTELVCKLVVRRFNVQTNEWSNEAFRISIPGPFAFFFELEPVAYGDVTATMVVQCILPPRAEIDSISWREARPTDEPQITGGI